MQLNSLCGKELMVQAPDQVTLNDWADSIEKVINEQAKKVSTIYYFVSYRETCLSYYYTVTYRETC